MIGSLFAALYVGHMVGDHLAQTDHQASRKAGPGRSGAGAMLGHILSYGVCQGAALALLALAEPGTRLPWWRLAAGLAVSLGTHAFIDRRWPVRWLLEHTGSAPFSRLASGGVNGMYLADQALHIGCLFAAALLMGWGAG